MDLTTDHPAFALEIQLPKFSYVEAWIATQAPHQYGSEAIVDRVTYFAKYFITPTSIIATYTSEKATSQPD